MLLKFISGPKLFHSETCFYSPRQCLELIAHFESIPETTLSIPSLPLDVLKNAISLIAGFIIPADIINPAIGETAFFTYFYIMIGYKHNGNAVLAISKQLEQLIDIININLYLSVAPVVYIAHYKQMRIHGPA